MSESGFRIGGGLDRFGLERLSRRVGGLRRFDISCRLLLREQGRMNLTALGNGFRLGLSLFDVVQLTVRYQRYVLVSLNHGRFCFSCFTQRHSDTEKILERGRNTISQDYSQKLGVSVCLCEIKHQILLRMEVMVSLRFRAKRGFGEDERRPSGGRARPTCCRSIQSRVGGPS